MKEKSKSEFPPRKQRLSYRLDISYKKLIFWDSMSSNSNIVVYILQASIVIAFIVYYIFFIGAY